MANCIAAGMLTLDNFPEIQYLAADYNLDGEITSEDVTLLEEAGLLGTVSTQNVEQDVTEEIELEEPEEEQETTMTLKVENFFTAVVSKISELFD